MLAELAAKALPALLGGLATGLVSGFVQKAVGGRGLYLNGNGNGLYLHKSGDCVEVEPTKGNGLRLTPKILFGVHGDGVWLNRGSQIYDGRVLLLGRNSPFKNISMLNLLL